MASDVAIIGAGIAGASLAWHLAAERSVLLLEAEDFPGYHTTGRSAALFSETYGNEVIRGLTSGSRAFYEAPPAGFTATPLLGPRGCLHIARADQAARLEAKMREIPKIRPIPPEAALRRVPALYPESVAVAGWDESEMDIDVHALHQGYLRGAKAQGTQLVTNTRIEAIERRDGAWQLASGAQRFAARILVIAAGAWADAVGALAGAAPIGLEPKRRTAVLIDPPAKYDITAWPMVFGVDDDFYFKPDAGRLMLSPADEIASPPCDAQPEELDIALCIDRIQRAADLPVRRVVRAWAGLRSFVADRSPVVGFDPKVEDLFWLAGQGGYGIQTAPGMGLLAASLCRGQGVPPALAAHGVTEAALSPARRAR